MRAHIRFMTRLQQITAAALFVCTAAASASNVIDQNQPNNDGDVAEFSAGGMAQSFQQAASNISGAGLHLSYMLDPSTGTVASVHGLVTISLWDGLPNAAGAHELASASATGTSGEWVDVFWSPVAVTPDTTYFLVFKDDATLRGATGGVYAPTAGFTTDYSRGMLYSGSGFQANPASDYTFRTYASDSYVAPSPVPEPDTYAMLLAGLGMVGFIGKRRKTA